MILPLMPPSELSGHGVLKASTFERPVEYFITTIPEIVETMPSKEFSEGLANVTITITGLTEKDLWELHERREEATLTLDDRRKLKIILRSDGRFIPAR